MAYTPIFGLGSSSRAPAWLGRALGGGGVGGGAFNINPPPQGGRGAYGAVPGAVGIPPSRYQQVSPVVGAPRAEPLIAENLFRDLSGDVDIESLQNDAARFGVATGMPMVGGGVGPSFTGVRGLNRTEQERRNIRREGLRDYLSAAQGIGALQTDPNLAFNVATQNAVWASAPNPQAAAERQMALWREQLNALSMSGGGGGSGRPWAGSFGTNIRSAGPAGGGRRDLLGFEQEDRPWATYPTPQAYGRADEYGFGVPVGGPTQGPEWTSEYNPYEYRLLNQNPNFGLGTSALEDEYGSAGYYGLEDFAPYEAEV